MLRAPLAHLRSASAPSSSSATAAALPRDRGLHHVRSLRAHVAGLGHVELQIILQARLAQPPPPSQFIFVLSEALDGKEELPKAFTRRVHC